MDTRPGKSTESVAPSGDLDLDELLACLGRDLLVGLAQRLDVELDCLD